MSAAVSIAELSQNNFSSSVSCRRAKDPAKERQKTTTKWPQKGPRNMSSVMKRRKKRMTNSSLFNHSTVSSVLIAHGISTTVFCFVDFLTTCLFVRKCVCVCGCVFACLCCVQKRCEIKKCLIGVTKAPFIIFNSMIHVDESHCCVIMKHTA